MRKPTLPIFFTRRRSDLEGSATTLIKTHYTGYDYRTLLLCLSR
jgi:hypothetical protein